MSLYFSNYLNLRVVAIHRIPRINDISLLFLFIAFGSFGSDLLLVTDFDFS